MTNTQKIILNIWWVPLWAAVVCITVIRVQASQSSRVCQHDNIAMASTHPSIFCLLTLFTVACLAAPRHRNTPQEYVKYDQRQEGEFNVRADLENFVILLIPTSPSAAPSPSPSPSLGLLDLLSKSIPLKKRNKHTIVKKDPTIESFIESKTAPYHVDIDENNDDNKKQHPELNAAAARLSRAFVITVPLDKEVVVKKEAKKDLKKKYVKEEGEMKLLGAENEQCGPGLSRDKDGICRVNKV